MCICVPTGKGVLFCLYEDRVSITCVVARCKILPGKVFGRIAVLALFCVFITISRDSLTKFIGFVDVEESEHSLFFMLLFLTVTESLPVLGPLKPRVYMLIL